MFYTLTILFCKVTMKDSSTKTLLSNDFYEDFPYDLASAYVELD